MNRRFHAAVVIARRQAFETLLAPGLYVTLALGLLLGFFLVTGFAASVDTAGFNPTLHPLYDTLGRFLTGTFGLAFVQKLFAEGPFLLALVVAFLPVFLFLAISSVFRFGQEKAAGAVELLTCGPADGTSYIVASFLRDVAFSAGSLLAIAAFLWAAAAMGNLVLGPMFLSLLPVLFVLSLAVFAYGILCSVLSASASSALAAFLGILVVFLVILAGSLSIASESVRSVASVAAAIVQWISPLYYAALCVRAAQAGSAAGVLGGLGLLVVLGAVLLAAAHLAISRRGVRA
jgi:small-conductance mechanosensitive channel